MKTVLNSDSLIVEINDHGAELCRIYDKEKNREVLWNADAAYWGRFAPVLFPMVGASFGGEYRHEGVTYKMGQHGFARDMEFTAESASADEAWYTLESSEETLKKYPFSFRFEVGHRVDDRKITVMWSVANTGDTTMYYNVGAHPAFRIPEGMKMTDFSFDFDTEEPRKYLRIEDPGSGCALTDVTGELKANEQGVVPVTEGFWSQGVYIFEETQVQELTLMAAGAPYVKITCEGFPFFGIWSKDHFPFVCMEPWQGRCDNQGYQGELKDKYGVRALPAGATEQFSYEIHVF